MWPRLQPYVGACCSSSPVALDIVSPSMTCLIHSSAAAFCLSLAESRVEHSVGAGRVQSAEPCLRPPSELVRRLALSLPPHPLSGPDPWQVRSRRSLLLCLLLCLLGGPGGGPFGRPGGGPGGGPGGAPGCRMCTVLRCSGPKSVAALRSLVAASWVGVEPIAMLKSTAGAESCGATSVRRVGACQCRKRRGGCGGRRRCVEQRAGSVRCSGEGRWRLTLVRLRLRLPA